MNNQRELLFGKRDMDLEINLPSSRVLKLQYVASFDTHIDAIDLNSADNEDDDIDEDDERGFNATLTYHWDYKKQPSKYVKINAKRDNYAKGSSRIVVDFLNYPNLRLFTVEVDRKRSFNETELGLALSYELVDGKKNKLEIDSILSSDRDSVSVSVEANLDRPKFNTYYASRIER